MSGLYTSVLVASKTSLAFWPAMVKLTEAAAGGVEMRPLVLGSAVFGIDSRAGGCYNDYNRFCSR